MISRKDSNNNATRDATPISSLRDPSTFAPPPKRVDNGGILPPPAHPSSNSSSSYPQQYGQHQHYAQQQPQEVEEPPPAPKPYRTDTTGLSTANLPPPPRRRDGADGRSPVTASPPPPYATSKPAPPSLPPRLPPRSGTASPGATPPRVSTPDNRQPPGFINQGAVGRLGAAGISVPGLGITRGNSPGAASPSSSGVGELQSRFAKFGVGSGSGAGTASTTPAPAAPSQGGTTWAQKQAAMRTMSDFKKDPSKVSLTDARSAASTANNFRQRHGEQVAAGVKTANGLDQKYGVSGKVGGYMGSGNNANAHDGAAGAGGAQSHLQTIGAAAGMLGKKKPPPPPPPKKKPNMGGDTLRDEDTPPPVPMSTRPSF